jgi:hypothetical protein
MLRIKAIYHLLLRLERCRRRQNNNIHVVIIQRNNNPRQLHASFIVVVVVVVLSLATQVATIFYHHFLCRVHLQFCLLLIGRPQKTKTKTKIMASEKFIDLADDDALTEFLNENSEGCIVCFSATWCGPCKVCIIEESDGVGGKIMNSLICAKTDNYCAPYFHSCNTTLTA